MNHKKEFDLDLIEKLAAEGCGHKEIAEGIEMTLNTFRSHLHRKPEIRVAIDRGKTKFEKNKNALKKELGVANEKPELTYAQAEAKIFEAIDQGFCTESMICKFLNGNARVTNVRDVIEGMELDRKIHQLEAGEITGYFRADKVPSKFWLDGTGKCAMEFPDVQPARRNFKEIFDEDNANSQKFNINSVLPPKPKVKDSVPADSAFQPDELPAAVEPEEMEPIPYNLSDAQDLAAELVAVAVSPRFEHTLQHISENGHSREGIERVKEKLVDVSSIPFPGNGDPIPFPGFVRIVEEKPSASKEIVFNSGKLSLSLDINLFEASPEERDFLNDLIDTVQNFDCNR